MAEDGLLSDDGAAGGLSINRLAARTVILDDGDDVTAEYYKNALT